MSGEFTFELKILIFVRFWIPLRPYRPMFLSCKNVVLAFQILALTSASEPPFMSISGRWRTYLFQCFSFDCNWCAYSDDLGHSLMEIFRWTPWPSVLNTQSKLRETNFCPLLAPGPDATTLRTKHKFWSFLCSFDSFCLCLFVRLIVCFLKSHLSLCLTIYQVDHARMDCRIIENRSLDQFKRVRYYTIRLDRLVFLFLFFPKIQYILRFFWSK